MKIGHTLVGSGKEHVLVLEGWFGDYAVWKPTFTSLDTDTFTYIFMDYRGYGKSKDIEGNYTMSEIAGDAIALVDEMGIDKFHLVGHSMGGMAMQRVIIDINDRKRVKSAVGVTPVPACGGQLDENSWGLFEGAIKSDENRYQILDFTTGNRHSAHWLNHLVKESRNTTLEKAYAGYLNAWVKENFAEEVNGIETPVLVCLGEHDMAFSEQAMQDTYLS